MTQLNAQFINPADGKTVDYLKDFSAGDQVHFSDIIIDISYDATEDATTFYFTEDTYEENIGWKFAGNLLDQYSAGDVLNLTFDVLNVGNYQALLLKASTTLKQLTRIITVPLIPIFKITNNLILT